MSGMRLDRWLWFARFAKTRSLAQRLCAEGAVTIGGTVMLKPGHPVRVGDLLSIRQRGMLHQVAVLALGTRRGPPAEARRLYAETAPPQSLRAAEAAAWEKLIEEA